VRALELSKEAKDRLAKLEELSDKAENGDKEAREELRRALRASSPAVVAEASRLAKKGEWGLIKTAAAGDPLAEEALLTRLELMRSEIAGPDPSPLEVLLTEKIVAMWMLTELLELLVSAQLTVSAKDKRVSHSFHKFYLGWLEQAHRRLLNTIRELARVRRLQSGVPSSQTNVQINLSKPDGD
jgi:CRP-like cAMP-binding protein